MIWCALVAALYLAAASMTNLLLTKKLDHIFRRTAEVSPSPKRGPPALRHSARLNISAQRSQEIPSTTSTDEETPLVSEFNPRSMILQNVPCWFYMLVVIFCITRAATLLWEALAAGFEDETDKMNGSRISQDITAAPANLLFYTVFILLLCHLACVSADAQSHRQKLVVALFAIFETLILIGCAVGLALQVTNAVEYAAEYFFEVVEAVMVLCYLACAVIVPKRLRGFGDELDRVASITQRVSALVAFFILLRASLLLPVVQSNLSVLGDGGYLLVMGFELIPVSATLFLLAHHSEH